MSDKTIIRLGTGGPVEQPTITKSDPRTGAQTIRRIHGAPADLFPLISQFVAAGYEVSFNPISPVNYELVATIGYAWSGSGIVDNPVDVWDITSNKVQQSLLRADIPIINSLTPDELLSLANASNQPGTSPPAGLSANGLIVFRAMVQGIEAHDVFVPVLRHTQTTSSVYAQQTALTGVGKIYSTKTMLLDATKGGQGVPNNLAVDLSAIESLYPNGKTGFSYGWFKDFPNITLAAYTKTQIHQDYIFGLWWLPEYNTPL